MPSTNGSDKELIIHWPDGGYEKRPANLQDGTDSNGDISVSQQSPAPNVGTASIPAAIFIVVNAAMGAGLLNFPRAFSDAGGIGPAIAMEMVGRVCLQSHCMSDHMLVRCLVSDLLCLHHLKSVHIGALRS